MLQKVDRQNSNTSGAQISPTSNAPSNERRNFHPETLEEEHELMGTSDSQSILSREDSNAFAVGNRKFLSPVHLGQSFAAGSEIDVPDGMFSQSKTMFIKRAGSGTSTSLN